MFPFEQNFSGAAAEDSDTFEAKTFYAFNMFDGLPEDILDIFVPDDENEMLQLEMNIVRWFARAKEREKVLQLQREHNLPLRPNQSLRDVVIRLKIVALTQQNTYVDDTDGYPGAQGGYPGAEGK